MKNLSRHLICTKKKCFSAETIRRLSLYLRNLRKLRENSVEIVSSNEISNFSNVSPEQFRRDLSYFGKFGKRGVGYTIDTLISELESILGMDKKWNVALVGVGSLGSALLGFEGFSKFNLKITCAFDVDNSKIGKDFYGATIYSIEDLATVITTENIEVAIIATFPDVAQAVADTLMDAGIKGILNFAPVALQTKSDVFVFDVDMACELESLLFFVDQKRIESELGEGRNLSVKRYR